MKRKLLLVGLALFFLSILVSAQGNLFVQMKSGTNMVLSNWRINNSSSAIAVMKQSSTSTVRLRDWKINNTTTGFYMYINDVNTLISLSNVSKLQLLDHKPAGYSSDYYKFKVYLKNGTVQEGWTSSYPFSNPKGTDINHYNESTTAPLIVYYQSSWILNINEIVFNSDNTISVSFQNQRETYRTVYYSNLTELKMVSYRPAGSSSYYYKFTFYYKNGVTKTMETAFYPFQSTYGTDISTSQKVYLSMTDVSYFQFDYVAPSLSISPSSMSLGYGSGSRTFTISSNVSWRVSDNASWISCSPTSGSDSRSVTATYSLNSSTSPRSAVITVTGSGITRTINVTQTGSPPPSLTTSKSQLSLGYDEGSTTFSITSNISWNVSDNADFILCTPSSGSNNQTITVNYPYNPSTSDRSGNITVSGSGITRTIPVIQVGSPPPSLTADISLIEAESAGLTTNLNITSNLDWSVSDNTDWIQCSPESGSENGSVQVSILENPTISSRSGVVTVIGGGLQETITVNQEASPPHLSFNRESISSSEHGGTSNVSLSSNINWNIIKANQADEWFTFFPLSGSANQNISLQVNPNLTLYPRSSFMVLSGSELYDTLLIYQEAKTYLEVAEDTIVVDYNQAEAYFQILSNKGWSILHNEPWISISQSTGADTIDIHLTLNENPKTVDRYAIISIKTTDNSQMHNLVVRQLAGLPTLEISETDFDLEADGSDLSVSVFSNTSFWLAESEYDWIALSSRSGNISKTFQIYVSDNTTFEDRNAKLVVYASESLSDTITIQQKGLEEVLSLSSDTLLFNAAAGESSIIINSNATWIIENLASWVQVTSLADSGTQVLNIAIEENSSLSSRFGLIKVSTKTLSQQLVLQQMASTTSIKRPSGYNNQSLDIYPNPVINNCRIVFSIPDNEAGELAIFSLKGEVIRTFSEEIRNEGVILYTPDLPPGTYIVKLTSKSGIKVKKLNVIR